MARINLDNDFWDDLRIELLEQKLASNRRNIKHEARGCFVSAIRLAQKYWAPKAGESEGLIPLHIWSSSGFDALVDVGLAEIRDAGVYVRGSSEHFEWIKNKRDAGKKSVAIRRVKYGTAQPVSENTSNTPRTDLEHTSNRSRTDLEHIPNISRTAPEPLVLDTALVPVPALDNKILNTHIFSSKHKKPKKSSAQQIDPSWLELGSKWLNFSSSIMPNGTSQYKDWNTESFAKQIRKVAEHLGRDAAFMELVLEFIRKDDFWRANAISPGTLMKISKNGMRKIDNITAKMTPPPAAKEIKLKTIDLDNPYAYEEEFRALLPENRRTAT
jgi:hypothetical protein